MPGYPLDHAGLEALSLADCLRLLASVPVGRVSFFADGELVVLPVNHAIVDQDVLFRTARGSKLSAAEGQNLVAFEADDYDPRTRGGWSVVISGRAEVVYDDAEIRALATLGLAPWADAVERSAWIRIRAASISGRRIPARRPDSGAANGDGQLPAVQVFDVCRGDARTAQSTPFGEVGTVFSGHGLELVWVRKEGEAMDENWFSSHDVDLLLVVQGQVKFQFDTAAQPDRVLGVGELLVLPAGTRCRAISWPRDSRQAAVFVAAYPVPGHQRATGPDRLSLQARPAP